MARVIITGSKGRMGQALVSCAKKISGLEVVGQIGRGDDLAGVIGNCDAVIDFSVHSATPQIARVCAQYNKALVIGTTGHSEVETAEILSLQKTMPIVWASNYSTGV